MAPTVDEVATMMAAQYEAGGGILYQNETAERIVTEFGGAFLKGEKGHWSIDRRVRESFRTLAGNPVWRVHRGVGYWERRPDSAAEDV